VIGLIDVFGEWVTFLICVFMLWFWMHIFDRYYKRRWPKDVAAAAAAASALSRAEKYGERHESSDDVDIELLRTYPPPLYYVSIEYRGGAILNRGSPSWCTVSYAVI
jgi:hypothetical protein